jgi:CRISPR-associated protein Cas1
MLTREWTEVLEATGLDPYLGYLHQPRHGRPSLALDLMEEFRPLIADSAVITAINNEVIRAKDFRRTQTAATLEHHAKKRFIETFERRMDELVTHPVFGYRISYRRVLGVQARLFARYLQGELDHYPEFTTR